MAKAKKDSLKADLNEIKKIFEAEDNEKNTLALSLIDEAIFLKETLKKCKADVRANGVTTIMVQGSYTIERENPALKSYNVSIKNYKSLIDRIIELLPTGKNTDDLFDDFGADA